MKIGDTISFFGKEAKVVEFNRTHFLIQFESGIKICTNRLIFKKES